MVLSQMMDLVVQDFPFSSIASDLNEKGFRSRDGKLWNQVSVFQMLPRLIEIGPGLFSTTEWAARREKLAKTR
jgi:Recombinase